MKTGLDLIAEERKELIEKYKIPYNIDTSYENRCGLIEGASILLDGVINKSTPPPNKWDYKTWFELICKSDKDRLITAGALIAAEIDRLNKLEVHLIKK